MTSLARGDREVEVGVVVLTLRHGEAQAGVDLGGSGGVEQHVVETPLRGETSEAALGEDGQQGVPIPVVRSTRQRERALAASRRASMMTTSQSGESTRAVASAGRMRTVWLSSPRAGSTSALGASALVSSSSRAISCRIGETGHVRTGPHQR